MGKKDTVTKDYMSVPEHFADAFNFYLFEGKQFVWADNLTPMDPVEFGIIFSNENSQMTQKIRDVLKQCVVMEDEKYTYLVLGIENQANVHYAMPVKNMIYDALNYGHQVSEIAKEHHKEKDIQEDEFLTGFSKTDKIKPVITLVVYFGTEEWDAPRCLKDMFDNVNEDILRFVSDYKLNLLIPKEIKDFSRFRTEFGKAMKYISVADRADGYKLVMNENPYEKISLDTVRLLNECVGMKLPVEKGEKNEMEICKATKALLDEGRLEGRLEGVTVLITTLRELGQPDEFIVSKIMEKFSLSEDEVKKYMMK